MNLTLSLWEPFSDFTIFLTSSWFFLRQRRSSFRDSTWASRSDLHTVSSPRIPRRPLMSVSTSWRRESSDSYLLQQKRHSQCLLCGTLWKVLRHTDDRRMTSKTHMPYFLLHTKSWKIQALWAFLAWKNITKGILVMCACRYVREEEKEPIIY